MVPFRKLNSPERVAEPAGVSKLENLDHLNSELRIRFAQKTEAGRKAENQDTVGARLPDSALLTSKGIAIAVADGVSSSKAARQASQSAITGFLTDYYATPDTWGTPQSAMQVIQSLNRYLWGQSRNSVLGEGHLTTFSALVLKGDRAYTFHVGDTRIYRLRSGVLEQLTRDHSQRIDRSTTYLSRALGADVHLTVDSESFELQRGDVFVLSSDGVHDAIPPADFQALTMSGVDDPDRLVDEMISRALDRGSEDNLSIQVALVSHTGSPTQSEALRLLSRLPFPPLLKPGQSWEGFLVRKILHESPRSQVYLVESPQGQSLVMKTPASQYQDDPVYIEHFIREAWIGARISSPHVARAILPRQERQSLYYLSEYVEGQTLEQIIRQRAPLPIPDAVELAGQLVRGLRAFHRREMLHQDMKPDNVVVSSRGAVIVDFGACWVAGLEEMGHPVDQGPMQGTYSYSAPEYRYGGPVGVRSDQFSLAVVLYEMLTGRLPYGEAYGRAKDLKDFLRLRYTPAGRHNPLVPDWMDRALQKALSIKPQDRYEALSEWMKDLERPRPEWVEAGGRPILERSPLLLWQGLALSGWLSALLIWWL